MKVYELLDAPEKWTQNAFARRADALSCDVKQPEASSWCLMGAIDKIYESNAAYVDVRDRAAARVGDDITRWNDAPSRTFEQVRALALELDI